MQGAQWREAQKIVKLCVTRSSSFSTPSSLGSSASAASASTQSSGISSMSVDTVSHHTSFAEAEISYRKELPGQCSVEVPLESPSYLMCLICIHEHDLVFDKEVDHLQLGETTCMLCRLQLLLYDCCRPFSGVCFQSVSSAHYWLQET